MRAYSAENSCSPGFWSKLAIDLRTGCLFPPLRRKLKLSQPQFADARDSRARTGLFPNLRGQAIARINSSGHMVQTFSKNYLSNMYGAIFRKVFEGGGLLATWPPSERSPPRRATNMHCGFCPTRKSKSVFAYI